MPGTKAKQARTRPWLPAACLAVVGACTALSPVILSPGCATTSTADAPNTGLETLANGSSPSPAVKVDDLKPDERGADDINLSEVFNRVPKKPAAPAPATTEPAAAKAPEPAVNKPALAATPEDPQKKVERLAGELRVAIAERSSPGRYSDALAMAALDTLGPGAGTADVSQLPPSQRRVVDAFRSVVRGLSAGNAAGGDPRAAADTLQSAAASLDDTQGVHIRRAMLCSRVNGFGRFEPVGGGGFVAGRPIRFIVYTELDRFGHRPVREADPGRAELGSTQSNEEPLAVELSQELGLWHDADGSAQWRRPEQTVIEVSRNRRRDFYLVQHVELPPTLSVGRYNLKITVRDHVTGGMDEAQVPLVVVADPSASLGSETTSR